MVNKNQKFLNVSPEQYERIIARYNLFLEAMNDSSKEPVNPFLPLSEKAVAELELIREVSRELQAKKNDDINKAAQAANEEAMKKEAEGQEQEQEEKTE